MIALVTGANQGLGRALAAGLAARMQPEDRVLLSGRDPARVAAAAADIPGAEPRVLDVRDEHAIHSLAEELGEIDILFSNATARMSPASDPADEVDAVAETSNLATTHILRAFGPRLRPGGRLIVVASSLGTLDQLDPSLHHLFDGVPLAAVEATVEAWRTAVHAGTAREQGWPAWINVPSKVAQVAAVRAVAAERRAEDLAAGTLVAAVCPGLVDTPASRPWFDDFSRALTPEQAAGRVLDFVLRPDVDPATYGELVRSGRVVPWRSGTPAVPRH